MRLPRTKYLYAAAALALVGAGAAQAATEKLHAMKVAAPDGSVVHVQYTGDVAPRVEVVPVEAVMPADAVVDPFAQMARISAIRLELKVISFRRLMISIACFGVPGRTIGLICTSITSSHSLL